LVRWSFRSSLVTWREHAIASARARRGHNCAQLFASGGYDRSVGEGRRLCSDKEGRRTKHKVAFSETSGGVSVSVPGPAGCWSQGTTETEALVNISDAISEYLAVRDEPRCDSEVRELEIV
jgi:predicted RNase H-like HicB family nuclease